ncbi:MAG TPA: response regulator [Armatimonadota bacterium]
MVLVVLADLFFQARLETSLRHLGYSVVPARGAEEVAARAREAGACGLLVEMGAQGFDWREAIRSVRGADDLASVPILAFGSHVDRDLHQEALELGASLTSSKGAISMNPGEVLHRLFGATGEKEAALGPVAEES